MNNDGPAGKPEYDGHRAIWIREFDWKKRLYRRKTEDDY